VLLGMMNNRRKSQKFRKYKKTHFPKMLFNQRLKLMRQTLLNQRGQSLLEYLVLVAIVGVGTLGMIRVLGQSLNTQYARVSKSLGAQVEGELPSVRVSGKMLQKKDMRNFLQGSTSSKSGSSDRDDSPSDESNLSDSTVDEGSQ
jgi:pilus assembly protein Flp/PilA